MIDIIKNIHFDNIIINEMKYALQIYLFWTFSHNVALYLYNKFCAPNSFISYLLTPIIAMSPHCKSLFYILDSSTDTMNKMMIGFSIWVIPKLTYFRSFTRQKEKDL